MIITRNEVSFENFVNQKIGVCDESSPKMRAVAETLLGDCTHPYSSFDKPSLKLDME